MASTQITQEKAKKRSHLKQFRMMEIWRQVNERPLSETHPNEGDIYFGIENEIMYDEFLPGNHDRFKRKMVASF